MRDLTFDRWTPRLLKAGDVKKGIFLNGKSHENKTVSLACQ